MKSLAFRWWLPIATLAVSAPAYANNWFACGNIMQIGWSCQLSNYPSTNYEYGMAHLTNEPLPVVCSYWNYGMRIYNKNPLLVASNNPQQGSSWGGFMFYTGTLATDDDTCSGGTWRHQYWRLDPNNAVVTNIWTNGCANDSYAIYCRAR